MSGARLLALGLAPGSALAAPSIGHLRGGTLTQGVTAVSPQAVGFCALGGLIGARFDGSVTNVCATGIISASGGSAGGLVGSNGSNNSGYGDTTTGIGTGIGANTATITGGGGLTSARMMRQSSFTGFDFSPPVWVIYNGPTTPLFNVFLTPLTVTASNQSQTYTGSTFVLLNPTYSVAGANTSGHLFRLGTPYNGAVNVGSRSPELWSDRQGYRITVVGGDLTITPKALSLSGLTASDKVYDGGTTASIFDWGSLLGVVGSDAVSLVTSGTTADFPDATVGASKIVTVTGLGRAGGSPANDILIGTQTTPEASTREPARPLGERSRSGELRPQRRLRRCRRLRIRSRSASTMAASGPRRSRLGAPDHRNGGAPCHRVMDPFARLTSTGDRCLP